jgi:hypothetical protein
VSNLVEKYYQGTTVADSKLLKRGQICWAPSQYLPSKVTTLELVHYEPTDERRNRYAVLPNPPPNLLFNHTPVHELHLEYNEELIIVKAKLRKLIVISQTPSLWSPGLGRLREIGLMCLPLYSFKSTDTAEFRSRIKALEYPWWVYIPGDSTYKMDEGFVRLDRLQVIEKNLIQPISVSVTDDALFLVSEWLRYCITGEIESIFLEDRQQIMQSLLKSP